ncbi:MAG TPA: ELWxxDGT repeat protein [Tepidisphaeraceae bacterium]|nr:ELWxxDGT repeat protein [Tepidisphaeraceae bacterium]
MSSFMSNGLEGCAKQRYRSQALKNAVKACAEQLENRLLLSGSPTATATVSNVYAAGGTSYTFTVTYQSNVPIVVSNLDGFDVRVEGANGFNQRANFVLVDNNTNGTSRTATYQVQSPGGVWDPSDSAVYSIVMQPSQVSDSAGNYVPAGVIGSFTVSIAATPIQPALLAACDSGVSSSDDLTNFNNSAPGKALQFVISDTDPGATLTLFADGTAIGSTVAGGLGAIVATDGSTILPDGVHSFTVTQTAPGGASTAPSAPLQVTIDTIAPPAPPAPQLQAASDSGFSSSDRITDIATPSFNLTASPYSQVYLNGTLVSAYGSTVYASPALADGTYAFTATAIDAAGNESAPSAASAVTIVTALPTATASAANVTAAGLDSYTFTVSYAASDGIDVTSLDGSDVVVSGPNGYSQPAALLSVSQATNGSPRVATYEVSAPNGNWGSSADGTYTITLQGSQVRDVAGNVAAGVVLATFTASVDSLGQPDLLAATDSGLYSNDNYTNFNNSTPAKALQFLVANTTAGAAVSIYSDGTLIGSATAAGSTTTVTTNGSTTLSDGTHAITARQTPVGGALSAPSAGLSITIDTVAPAAPAPPKLDPANDNGPSNSDGITNVAQPVFDITANEPGTVHLEGTGADGGGLSAAAPVAGQYAIPFAPPAGFSNPPALSGVATGNMPILITCDVNGDGKPDLVVAAPDQSKLSVFFSNGDGTYTAGPVTLLTVAPMSIATADFNGDGKADLVITGVDNTTRVYLGTGSGTFTAGVILQTGSVQVVAGDFNQDHLADVIVTGDGIAWLFLGNGNGTFTAGPTPGIPLTQPVTLVTSDIFHNGQTDVFASGGHNPGYLGLVLEPTTTGVFSNPYSVNLPANTILAGAADFDGDGLVDLVELTRVAATGQSSLTILWNSVSKGFATSTTITLPSNTVGNVQIGDFNGDGRPDLAIASATNDTTTPGAINIIYNGGNRTFLPTSSLATINRPTDLEIADVNGDKRTDFVVAGASQSVATVLQTGGVLPNGAHSMYAWVEDLAGNRSPNSATTPITLDTSVPTAVLNAPQVTSLNSGSYQFTVAYSDVGSGIDPASIGSNNLLVLGPGTANSQLASLVSTTATGNGVNAVYSVVIPATGVDGNYSVSMQASQVRDIAGNYVAANVVGTFNVTLAPAKPVLVAAADTGISSTDGITNFNNASPAKALQFSVGGTASGDTITIYADGVAIGSAIASGTTTLVTTNGAMALADGAHSITARRIFAGGAQGTVSAALSITIDATAPAAPVAPDLQAASDSGFSNTDNITNVVAPIFTMAGTPYYRVYRNGVLVSTSYATGSFTSGNLPDGTYSFTETSVDAAGNESTPSAPLSVTIDTVAPAAPPAPTLDPSSDSGSSHSDGVTNATTPGFDVTSNGPGVVHLEGYGVDGGGVSANVTGAGSHLVAFNPAGTIETTPTQIPGAAADGTVVAADLNGDGIPDIIGAEGVVGGFTSSTITVSLGNGDGTFRPAINLTTTFNSYGATVLVGDVNGDGKPDIVALDIDDVTSNTSVNVFLGNGDGTFQAPLSQTVSFRLGGGQLADMDGDGKLDLVVSSNSNGSIYTLFGKGDGTFGAPTNQISIGDAESFYVGDLNGDGKPDLAVPEGGTLVGTSSANSAVAIFLNQGNGIEKQFASYPLAGGTSINDITAADVNHDGKPDLIVPGGASIVVLLGRGDGSFGGNGFDLVPTYTPNPVAVADINGDGNPDLISTYDVNSAFGRLVVDYGNGTGAFGPPVTLVSTTSNMSQVLAADLNRDGRPDLVVGFPFGGTDVYPGSGGALRDGTHSIYAWTEDAAGNRSPNSPNTTITVDTTPPAAALNAPAVTSGATTLTFTVTYSDATSGLDVSSLNGSNLTVTGPNGYTAAAAFVSVDTSTNGSPRTATYRVAAPGGAWDSADNGTYSVNMQASQVRDVAGNAIPAGVVGQFSVSLVAGNILVGKSSLPGTSPSKSPVSPTVSKKPTPPAKAPVKPAPVKPVPVKSPAPTPAAKSPAPQSTSKGSTVLVSGKQTTSQSGSLLDDIFPGTQSSATAQYTPVTGGIYFVNAISSGGKALYKTDGTAAGTVLLSTASSIQILAALGNTLLFSNGTQLLRTDGTVAGTHAIMSLTVSGAGVAINNAVYFAASTSAQGVELWRSDGTAAGTSLVADINPGTGSSGPTLLTNVFGTLFFVANDGVHGAELWKSDGTAAGTVIVKDINPGTSSSGIPSLTNVGGTLFFTANDGVHGFELWESDGTAGGTVMVKDISAGPTSSAPANITNVNGYAFFTTPDGALWESDGTAGGTMSVMSGLIATSLVSFDSQLYFINNGNQLWTSDGTPGGTVEVAAVPGASQLTVGASRLFFSATDAVHGTELWTSDGTTSGTSLLADIDSGAGGSAPAGFTVSGSEVYFNANDGLHGTELWRSDGTAAGTVLADDVNSTPNSSNPSGFFPFHHDAAFFATGAAGYGLYISDGTPEGLSLVSPASVAPSAVVGNSIFFVLNGNLMQTDGTASSTHQVAAFSTTITGMYSVNGVLIFTTQQSNGPQLWRSDGTAAGTYTILAANNNLIYGPTVSVNRLFFYANDGTHGYEPWVSDGTVAGTIMLKDVNPGAGSSAINNGYGSWAITPVPTGIVFGASDGTTAGALWFSDGTSANTHSVIDPTTSQPFAFTYGWSFAKLPTYISSSTGYAFFMGALGSKAPILYRTDGTAAGTVALAQMTNSNQGPEAFAEVNGEIFVAIANGSSLANGFTLWKTNGTVAGTQALANIADNSGHGVTAMVNVGGTLYIQASNLWISDGTPAGTVQLAAGSTIPTAGFVVDGATFYAGSDSNGTELWTIPASAPPLPPMPVTSPLALTVSSQEIDLTWADSPTNTDSSVRIQRSTSSGFTTIDETVVLVGGATHFNDTGIVPGTTYYYRIYTQNAGGTSAAVTVSSATTGAPAAPARLAAVAAGGSQSGLEVDLSWADNSNNETGFTLQRSLVANFSTIDATFTLAANATAYSDTTVAPSLTYYYRIRSFNAAGNSAFAAVGPVVVPTTIPTAPSGLQLAAVSSSEIDLQWIDNSSNETQFSIERAVLDGPFIQIGTVAANVTSYADTTAAPNTVYQYRIRALTANSPSGYSNTAQATTLPAQTASLVADINTTPSSPTASSSDPTAIVTMNGLGYFAAHDSSGNWGIWQTDGTAAGTTLITYTNGTPTVMTVSGSHLYFLSDGNSQLWTSDGTAVGTQLVYDLGVSGSSTACAMVNMNGTLIFTPDGLSVWSSNGTSSGTAKLATVTTTLQYLSAPVSLVVAGNRTFFGGSDGTHGLELWATDGTVAGTGMVADIFAGANGSFPSNLTAYNGKLMFVANDNIHGRQLWSSDGTAAGTALVADIDPVDHAPIIQSLAVFNNYVYFGANNNQNVGLWRTDGTAAGTVEIATGFMPTGLVNVNGTLYFAGMNTVATLYKSDGTLAGTQSIENIPGSTSTQPNYQTPVAVGNRLFFNGTNGTSLWSSDGTVQGTAVVAGSTQAITDSVFGNALFFNANDGVHGNELWRSDGTITGTTLFKDINLHTADSNPVNFVSFNSAVYFIATNSAGASTLFQTDGTSGGTVAVGPATGNLIAFNGALYFSNSDSTHGTELWTSNGTPGNESLVKDLTPGTGSSTITYPTVSGGYLYFLVQSNGTGPATLWRTDGANTIQLSIASVITAPAGFPAAVPTDVNGTLYFAADDGTHGQELWSSNGTTAGTQMVADINPSGASYASEFVNYNGTLYFAANNGTSWGLWESNGSSSGTVLVQSFAGTGQAVLNLAVANGRLFFSGSDAVDGAELWSSDGTSAGTMRVADIDPGSASSDPANFFAAGGITYFTALDGPTDSRNGLWRTDGTAAGTSRIRDLTLGIAQPYMLNVGGVLYYYDGYHIWRSDGTFAGTVQAATIDTAAVTPVGAPMALLGNSLLFAERDAALGRELFSIATTQPAPVGTLRVSSLFSSAQSSGMSQSTTPTAIVTWSDNSNNETGFLLQRSTSSNFAVIDLSVLLPANSTQYTDNAISPSVTYYYRVSAVNAAGSSAFSNVASTVDIAPQVAGVSFGSSQWTSAFPDAGGYAIPTGPAQLTDLPWINLDTISITFTEAVNITQNSLSITGVNIAAYTASGFSYNAATFTATWTFAVPFGADKLLLTLASTGVNAVTDAAGKPLNGAWNNGSGAFPSGGAAGGDFNFNVNILPGDVDGSGAVNIIDTVATRNLQFNSAGSPAYSIFNDVDGNGSISIIDTINVRNRQFTSLPT